MLPKFLRLHWFYWMSPVLFASLALLSAVPSIAAASPEGTITDPTVLQALEQQGLSLSTRLELPVVQANAADLLASPVYSSIVQTIEEDLEKIRQSDSKLGVGMGWSHRLFDPKWLRSKEARFVLIAIVARMDRQPFAPQHCGETRAVYRLEYSQLRQGMRVTSRLPLTINFVSWAEKGEGEYPCREVAASWSRFESVDQGKLVGRLVSSQGPLAPEKLALSRTKSIELNLQSVRWPSTVRPEFGNHAEYLLRAFVPLPEKSAGGGGAAVAPLENTPDVKRILAEGKQGDELLSWIKQNHIAVDSGIATVPERFLARIAVSVAPRGPERLANQPFSQLFSAEKFKGLNFSQHRFTKSPEAFLRRLNDLSCMGCHQNRSIAGFHLLGEETLNSAPGNQLAVIGSPHFLGDMWRRSQYLEMLSGGAAPEESRPLSERAAGEFGGYGVRCGLGDPSFDSWGCAPGLTCKNVGDSLVGECFPGTSEIGDPCELSNVVSFADSRLDRINNIRRSICPGVCESTPVGFPRGLCSSDCSSLSGVDALGSAVCGDIAVLNGFNSCLAKGDPFPQCLTNNIRPATLRSCSAETPCRDDYVCARTLKGDGACIPPYFLFQLRVDGHPTGKEGLVGRVSQRIERLLR